MSRTLDLVLEVGCEELPDDLVEDARARFAASLEKRLGEVRLAPGEVRALVTPRRLAAVVRAIPARQPTVREVVTGPPKSAAFGPDGTPTRAAEGFARGQGVAPSELVVVETPKGPYMAVKRKVPGRPAREVLQALLPEVLAGIHWAKAMRWGRGVGPFARPVRWICAVAGGKALKFEFAGQMAGNRSRGHRYLSPKPFAVRTPDDYLKEMAERHVVLDTVERAAKIASALETAARKAGGSAVADADLVAVTAAKTEWPVAVVGRFDEKYLELPREVLVTSMREHQDDFAVEGPDGRLLPAFVNFADHEAPDMGVIARGNERVLRARLDDARFFYQEDRKRPLADYAPRLDTFLFQKKLGSVGDKARRVTALARNLAPALDADPDLAARAASLCKCDLVTGMVYEFPELQGVMGRIYALADGEPEEVARAIEQHYRPVEAGGDLPEGPLARTVAIADKLDTLCGIFGVGLIPTGSQDPYALRRAGLGVVLMLAGRKSVNLKEAVERAAGGLADRIDRKPETVTEEVMNFLKGRLAMALTTFPAKVEGVQLGTEGTTKSEGIRHDVAEAVLSADFTDVHDAWERARALNALTAEPGFDDLMVSFRRVMRIIPEGFVPAADASWREGLDASAEQALWDAFWDRRDAMGADRPAADRLAAMASLRPQVDAYFDAVLVMDPDEAVRHRRLSMLSRIRDAFGTFADFGQVVVG